MAELPLGERLLRVRDRLTQAGFRGDFETGLGARQVAATDNSIYEVRPAGIAYPTCAHDVEALVQAARSDPGRPISITARGGNTGTNGQSLNDGIIIDFARHMNRILAIDVDASIATVEPGVVLDQLNDALAASGLFFPPNVSTASRATIGGMVATDASGKGSRRYGKTSDYIEAMDLVLSDASSWRATAIPLSEAEALGTRADIVGAVHREVLRAVTDHAAEIAAVFPDMNRGLTGYNLQKAFDRQSSIFSLPYLLAGSEGTLALTTAITLRVQRRPKQRVMVVIPYPAFGDALRDVPRLLEADPTAVEVLDDKVMHVARSDVLWKRIEAILGALGDVAALNFVEFTGDSLEALEAQARSIVPLIGRESLSAGAAVMIRDQAAIGALWSLREKSVGLLGRIGGGKQGTPFVEDTAVPPEKLPDYVTEFRELLDGFGLKYGMFGHADVGCLHVRPFLDLKDPAQAALVRPISDSVAALTKKYGGLLWGEHGRGFRGEYSPFFFGSTLFGAVGRIKAAFDPEG